MKRRHLLAMTVLLAIAWFGWHTFAGAQQVLVLPAEPGKGLPGPASPTPPAVTPTGPVDFSGAGARQEPSLHLEWSGPATVRVGYPNTFTLTVRNTGAAHLQQVAVRVRLPEGWSLDSAEPQAAAKDNVFVWLLGTLSTRQERQVNMRITSSTKGDFVPQAWATFTTAAELRVKASEPKLTLKASGPEQCQLGDGTAIVFSVSNPGDGVAEKVKVQAVLSDGLEHTKGRRVEFDLGNVAPGDTRSVQLLCAVKAGGQQWCQASAEGEGGLRATDKTTLAVVAPQLDIVVKGPKTRYLDRKATYTFKVANTGDAPATNVTVTDVVPNGFKFSSADSGGRFDSTSRVATWVLGDIAPRQSREVSLELVGAGTGEFVQKAQAVSGRGLKATAEHATAIEGLSAILLEVVDRDDPVEVGGEVVYEVRITNTGSKTETDLRLVCSAPDQLAVKSINGPTDYTRHGPEISFAPLPKLAPRANVVYRITCKANAAGVVQFKTRVTSTILAEPVHKDEATRVYAD